MARSRNIKPSFFLNDELAELPPLTRLLFIGLWCIADRDGYLEDRPNKIKAEILPYDNCDINKMLESLNGNFIKRYSVKGQKYILINNFSKHQNPHLKEQPSEIPRIEQVTDEHHTSTILAPDLHHTSPADSLNPITDSLNPIYGQNDQDYENKFEEFYKKYSKKVKKQEVKKWFKKNKPSNELFSSIMNSLEQFRASKDWQKDGGQFIPYPSTWLNQKRWEDENITQNNFKTEIKKITNFNNYEKRNYDNLNNLYANKGG